MKRFSTRLTALLTALVLPASAMAAPVVTNGSYTCWIG